ncbi:hypothetical protein DPMN_186402, partial [Dreissena polymorpha]
MVKFNETEVVPKKWHNNRWIAKTIPYPTKRFKYIDANKRRDKELNLVVIRNKYTNEIVDLE